MGWMFEEESGDGDSGPVEVVAGEEEEPGWSECEEPGVGLGEVARESLLWLADRLGPSLTARHLTSGLLQSACKAAGEEGGEWRLEMVLGSLRELASLYGDAFVILHFIPFAVTAMRTGRRFV